MHRSVRESIRRSVLPCLVLVLLVTAVPRPARAADHPSGALSRSLSALWEAIVAVVVPSGWVEKLGPGMDPDDLPAGSCPSGGCDLGPDMDPNG